MEKNNKLVPILAFSCTVCYGHGHGVVILTANGDTGTVHGRGEWGSPWPSLANCAVLDPNKSN